MVSYPLNQLPITFGFSNVHLLQMRFFSLIFISGDDDYLVQSFEKLFFFFFESNLFKGLYESNLQADVFFQGFDSLNLLFDVTQQCEAFFACRESYNNSHGAS